MVKVIAGKAKVNVRKHTRETASGAAPVKEHARTVKAKSSLKVVDTSAVGTKVRKMTKPKRKGAEKAPKHITNLPAVIPGQTVVTHTPDTPAAGKPKKTMDPAHKAKMMAAAAAAREKKKAEKAAAEAAKAAKKAEKKPKAAAKKKPKSAPKAAAKKPAAKKKAAAKPAKKAAAKKPKAAAKRKSAAKKK